MTQILLQAAAQVLNVTAPALRGRTLIAEDPAIASFVQTGFGADIWIGLAGLAVLAITGVVAVMREVRIETETGKEDW